MHDSAMNIGTKFLNNYWHPGMHDVLEIGSLNVNGSLRQNAPIDSEWFGVDLTPGDGVDLVIQSASSLPFSENSFDLVIATSVFEHDPMFWLTFHELIRVVKETGYIYICAPSNGWVHRYPFDVYRFYPDAGIALEQWGKRVNPRFRLVESFISERANDVWNDFCAVFTLSDKSPEFKIFLDTDCTNVWSEGEFLLETLSEIPEDMRIIETLRNQTSILKSDYQSLTSQTELLKEMVEVLQIEQDGLSKSLEKEINRNKERETLNKYTEQQLLRMTKSRSWRVTAPLRQIYRWLSKDS